uniref:CAA30375.1 protein n=1 Tax=Oryza sativa TaxID=4530 RepID=Q9ST92_ORYSA|nr:CAA30375.1 protein [Oryza sativa]
MNPYSIIIIVLAHDRLGNIPLKVIRGLFDRKNTDDFVHGMDGKKIENRRPNRADWTGGFFGLELRRHFLGKSMPKVPQLVIELQNRSPTAKPDIRHLLTNQN